MKISPHLWCLHFKKLYIAYWGKLWGSLRHLPRQIASYDANLWWQQPVFYGSCVVLNFVHQAWDEIENYSTTSLSTVIREHAHNCAVLRSDTVPEGEVPVTASMCRWSSETLLSEGKNGRTGRGTACMRDVCRFVIVGKAAISFLRMPLCPGISLAWAWLHWDEKIRFKKPDQAVSNDWWLRRDFILSRLASELNKSKKWRWRHSGPQIPISRGAPNRRLS